MSCLKQGATLGLPFGSKKVAALIHGRYPFSEARRTHDMKVLLQSHTGELNADASMLSWACPRSVRDLLLEDWQTQSILQLPARAEVCIFSFSSRGAFPPGEVARQIKRGKVLDKGLN